MNVIPTKLLLMVACLVLLAAAPALSAAAEVRIAAMHGTVEVGHGDPASWSAARQGQRIAPGSAVRTGPASRAELDLGSGRTARMFENSVLRLPAADVPEATLSRGHTMFDVTPGMSPRGFEVRTPEVVVSVKGTRFLVAAPSGGAHGTAVFRGAVEMVAGGESVRVVPGLMAVLEAGHVALRDVPFDDPWDGFGSAAPELARVDADLGPAVRALSERVVSESERLEPQLERAGFTVVREEGAPAKAAGEIVGELPAASLDPVADVQVRLIQQSGTTVSSSGSATPIQSVVATTGSSGGATAGTAGASFPFQFQRITSGGPNRLIVTFATQTIMLTSNDITAIQSGDPSRYGNFLQVIQQLGIDPVELANFIDDNWL